jgi:peroxiredoxin
MLPLGTIAPEFRLPDVSSGRFVTLDDFPDAKAFLVMFICRHCPYVKHVQSELARIGRDYATKPVGIVAISSNDAVAYPDDNPASLAEMVKEQGFQFPLCFDESQEIAKAFTAACTPDFFVFDSSRKLTYRGQLDDSRPRNEIPVTGRDVRAALDALLAGTPVSTDQVPSLGCNIKWKQSS